MKTRLFVYGTLKPGWGNYRQIERYVQTVQAATISGVLADLGGIPALVPGAGIVRGVLLEIDEAALTVTDRIEGYRPGGDNSFYLRKEVNVNLEKGGTTTAWTYYLDPAHQRPDLALLQVDENDGVPVFAWHRR